MVQGFRLAIFANLVPYVTSEWAGHSLMTTIPIVAKAMTAAVYIPMAKMLDVWGRAESFLLMVGLSTLGMVLSTAANNLYTFSAAQVCKTG